MSLCQAATPVNAKSAAKLQPVEQLMRSWASTAGDTGPPLLVRNRSKPVAAAFGGKQT